MRELISTIFIFLGGVGLVGFNFFSNQLNRSGQVVFFAVLLAFIIVLTLMWAHQGGQEFRKNWNSHMRMKRTRKSISFRV